VLPEIRGRSLRYLLLTADIEHTPACLFDEPLEDLLLGEIAALVAKGRIGELTQDGNAESSH